MVGNDYTTLIGRICREVLITSIEPIRAEDVERRDEGSE